MSLQILMGRGLSQSDSEESGESDDSYDDDDESLVELGAKYMTQLGEALKSGDGAEAFKLFGRLRELCDFQESKERGY